jgi:farnesyl-diphosphate farnesyltransferase
VQYCHYVAGLVGIGLSRLFAASGLEEKEVGLDHRLANSMGLFLQKTNIIRDYLEDVQEERHFWPKEAWSQFGSQLEDLALPQHRTAAVHCLNLLITNALQHVPDVLLYMSRIRNQSVFNFCAIPQTMAIATLAVCYNNPNVFTGVVKIRKGQAVALMMESTNMTQIQAIMTQFAEEVTQKIEEGDPSGSDTRAITQQIKNLCCQSRPPHPSSPSPLSPQALSLPLVGLVMAGAAASLVYWSTNYSSTTV